MATYGFGAAYGGTEHKQDDFISRGRAYVGWDVNAAPYAHAMLRQIEVADLIFIKSAPPSIGLIIKAIGYVTDTTLVTDDLGTGIPVHWVWNGWEEFGKISDKADFMRGGTLFREHNPGVILTVMGVLRTGSFPARSPDLVV